MKPQHPLINKLRGHMAVFEGAVRQHAYAVGKADFEGHVKRLDNARAKLTASVREINTILMLNDGLDEIRARIQALEKENSDRQVLQQMMRKV